MHKTAPFVFLSHSSSDTAAAWTLKRQLENALDAKSAGLKVWFDKDDLRPGGHWQSQIEQVIEKDASAFVVYVGSRGVVNWVDVEVRVALSRAATDKDFLFIPVLAPEIGASALPPFARLHHYVADPLGKGDGLERLLKAVLKSNWDKAPKLIDEPFVGLCAMREEEADRFFGRDAEVKQLVEKFRKHRLVAIVADSGTGKSSLAEAGFARAFRGGALADVARADPDDRVWHVVSMRPGFNPEEGLRTGVSEAAQKLGLSVGDQSSLRKLVTVGDPSETSFGVQCNLPPKKTATLLIVDQFEELFTATPDALVAPFVKLLLALADGDKDVHMLLTVRADYFNLLRNVKDAAGQAIRGTNGKTLFERLDAEVGDAILRLKRVSEDGLRDIICRPLRLAGVNADQSALVKAVQRDISDQPSDLPLLQVALKAAWREHKATTLGLLEAYHLVGGVLGALAREAEAVRAKLSADDQARLESIFVRLVRLGDTGGATRRTAALAEFDAPRQALLRRLGDDEHGRLVVVGEARAEIAHEALITQWPWLVRTLRNDDARDVRTLDRLMTRSREWLEAPVERRREFLAAGAEREIFARLAEARRDWLSEADREFVVESNRVFEAEREKEENAFRVARQNLSIALTTLANIQAARRPVNAAKLALAAWPRDSDDTVTPKLSETLDVLGRIVPNLRERLLIKDANFAAFSPDGLRIVTASNDKTARVWDAATGEAIAVLSGHVCPVTSVAFSLDGTRIVTASSDDTARVWDAATGKTTVVLSVHNNFLRSASLSPDGTRVVTVFEEPSAAFSHHWPDILTTSSGNITRVPFPAFRPNLQTLWDTVRVWDAATGTAIAVIKGFQQRVLSAAFSPDGSRIVTASEVKTPRVWDAATGREIAALKGHAGSVVFAAFSHDGTRIVTASYDTTARVWDAARSHKISALWSRKILVLRGHGGPVVWAVFSPKGSHIVTASNDKTARVWDAATGEAIAILSGHEGALSSAAFSPDGSQVVTASLDKTARVWDTGTGKAVAILSGHEGAVSSAAFSPEGSRILTTSEDKTARVWKVATAIVALSGHGSTVNSAAFSLDGSRVVTASSDNTARVWDAATGEATAIMRGHKGAVRSAADTARVLRGHTGAVRYAAFGPDGSRIVTASDDNTAGVWDAATGKAIMTFELGFFSMRSAAFSPDGSRIVTASFGSTQVWDAATGKAIMTFGPGFGAHSAAFSSDGSRIVTVSVGSTRVWDAATGERIAEWPFSAAPSSSGEFYSVALSPDGTRIVTAFGDDTARLREAASGRELAALAGHQGTVSSVAFSQDGTRIVTASSDDTARVWDAATGKTIAVLSGHGSSVRSAAFSSDGTRVVTASEDKTARIWDVGGIPKGNILQVACALLKMSEDPVTLDGVTDYPLTFDRPICVTDPPSPDPLGETEAKTAQ